ncbi:transposase [Cupriavidus basilensis]|uniref:transposase n=1 Tax=Cupriavidus basilensis TaxID=68895 RepID=UPI003D34A978
MVGWASLLATATLIGSTFCNEPRRRFTNEYKRQVVQTLLASPMWLSRVAREHDLNHNQLARRRREYEQGKCGTAANEVTEFVPVCNSAQFGWQWLPTRCAPIEHQHFVVRRQRQEPAHQSAKPPVHPLPGRAILRQHAPARSRAHQISKASMISLRSGFLRRPHWSGLGCKPSVAARCTSVRSLD